MKIACDIKSRIVNEQLQYEDFMIITNQASYSDYLTICFDELNIPATLSQNEACHYNSDYRKMSRSLSECKGHTFKEIIQFLQKQDISASMIKTLTINVMMKSVLKSLIYSSNVLFQVKEKQIRQVLL